MVRATGMANEVTRRTAWGLISSSRFHRLGGHGLFLQFTLAPI